MGTATRFRLTDELFRAVVKLDVAERAAYIDRQCGEDGALKAVVLALLREDERVEGTLDRPVFDSSVLRASIAAEASADAGPLPEMIGRYRVVREIGRGGMGIVYEAIQENPRRTVALKVISAGLGSRGLLRRFEHEAAALGRLQHPGIAQIYEAGTFQIGGRVQPYFAMELVRGRPLREYADDHRLDAGARLRLIAVICDAVEHAHQRGVIHRDLKPSNILVVEDASSADERSGPRPHPRMEEAIGQPKILDFGVARITDPGSDAVSVTTFQTDMGQLIGTVQYMSPEQAAGDPRRIDTRSDVYSLGVLAYELITGRLPYRSQDKLVHEAVRMIREDDPTPLSTVNRLYRGDIQTIIAKALEKDPARRYQSAGELGADIRRYLRDEPILARPTSAVYQLRRFARRNKALVGAVATGFVLMLVGLVTSVREAHHARMAQLDAEQKSAESRRQTIRATVTAAAMEIDSGNAAAASRRLQGIDPPDRHFEWRYLNARLDDSIAWIKDDGPIAGAQQTTDGREVLTLSSRGVLKRWEAWTARELDSRSLCEGPVLNAAFSADGARIVAVVKSDGFKLRLWDLGNSTPIELGVIPRGPRRVTLSPSGRWAAVAFAATGFDFFDVDARSQETIKTNGTVQDLVFDATGRLTWANGANVFVMDCESGAPVFKQTIEIGAMAADCCADGSMLLFGDSNKTVHLLELPTGRPIATLTGHFARVRGIRFVPNSSLAVSVGQEQAMIVWNLDEGRILRRLLRPDSIGSSSDLQTGASTIITRSGAGIVSVWDVNADPDDRNVLHHDSYVYAVAFSPDGRQIVTGGWDKAIRVWDASTRRSLRVISGDHGFVTALAVSPDGRWIVSGHHVAGGGPAALRLWDAATGELIHDFPSQRGEAKSIVFDPGGRRFAVIRTHAPLTMCDVVTHQCAELASVREAMGTCMDWSRDGKRLVVCYGDGVVRMLSLDSGEVTREFKIKDTFANDCAFKPDGRVLATALDDGTVRLWDVESGGCQRIVRGHTEPVLAVAFSPDGSRLASGSRDTSIRLWDAASGDEMIQLRGHGQYVRRLAFSPDGSMLASGSGDGTARLWDTRPTHDRRRDPETAMDARGQP